MLRDSRGFSVIELAMVLTLVALLAMIVNPAISPFAQRSSARSAVDEFLTFHSLARSMAVKYGRVTELNLDPTLGRYWIEVDATGAGTADTVRMVADLTERGVQMSSDRTRLCFDVRGIQTARGGCGSGLTTVVFTATNYRDTVWITAAGNAIR